MVSMWKRGSALAMLLAVLFVGGACDTSTEPVQDVDRLEAEAPDELLGGILRRVLGRAVPELVETVVTIVEGVTSHVIGPRGGVLAILDHGLSVPAGAVGTRTEFTMATIPGNTIEVELTARDARTGRDVGKRGFKRPVELSLSYAGTDVRDPSELTIVRILPDGRRVPVDSRVDRKRKVVVAELDHFSRYGLCRN